MKKVLAIAIVAFMASCGTQNQEAETVQKEYNLSEMTAPTTLTARIEGMTCAVGCAQAIQKELAGMPGVVVSNVNFGEGIGTFSYEAADVKAEEIIAAIEAVNDGAYKVSKNHVEAGIKKTEEESDVEALHSEKKVDEASV